jgi:hypothetical protein
MLPAHHPENQPLLSLESEKPFATGGLRDVFIHPGDASLCIKVWRKDRTPQQLKAKKPLHRRWRKTTASFDENLHDWRCLQRMEQLNDDEIWKYIPRCHGFIATDRGKGLVVELIRDHDGYISRSLLDRLWETGDKELFSSAIAAFSRFWINHTIPNRKLALFNLAAQEISKGKFHLHLIDGFLNRSPLTAQ